MNTKWRNWNWFLTLKILLFIGGAFGEAVWQTFTFSVNCAFAQITPDGTLPNNSIVTSQGNIKLIEGGTQAGNNLFHSFSEFSVPTDGVAHFNNSLNIQNIITRITGRSASNINGLIQANGKANLFLLNPNGITFDSNARLNIGGSFLASTASVVKFADGTQFSAIAPQTTALLTISVPIGLQYGSNPGSIVSKSLAPGNDGLPAGLQMQPGKSLALVGGDVKLDGGSLQAPAGRVELGAMAGLGTVGVSVNDQNLNLSFPVEAPLKDVSLTNNSGVRVEYPTGGGSIAINARNLEISGGSGLVAGISSSLKPVEVQSGNQVGKQPGNIDINATDTVTITGANAIGDNSGIMNFAGAEATGKAGNINIQTNSLNLTKGAFLDTSTYGKVNGGNVTIRAKDKVVLDRGRVSSTAANLFGMGAEGNGGNIDITTKSLTVSNGGFLSASTYGKGNAGNVKIVATDNVLFSDSVKIQVPNFLTFKTEEFELRSGASSTVEEEAEGNGGSIDINTRSLTVRNNAELAVGTLGKGNAGSMTIRATDGVSFNSGFASSAAERVEGIVGTRRAGDINITTGSLDVTNGAQLAAYTRGKGSAGTVNINARDRVFFDGIGSNGFSSGAISVVDKGGEGNSGNINITTGSLTLSNGAQLQVLTNGKGNAGNIKIQAADTVSFDGEDTGGVGKQFFSSAFSTVEEEGQGNGGNIDITAKSLIVGNGAGLAASTRGKGNAGNVTIRADTISFDGRGANGFYSNATSRVEEKAFGNGGNIDIATKELTLSNGALLQTSTVGTGSAGNILIQATDKVSFDKRSLALSTVEKAGAIGNSGNIDITTKSLSMTNGSQLQVLTRGQGSAGTVTIRATDQVSFDGVSSEGYPSAAASTVEAGAVGNGGGINITTGSLSVTNNALLSASSQGNGAAGNIEVAARSIKLDNQANLTAQTASGKGGDIRLQNLDLLLLRHHSQISTTAGTQEQPGDGGKIEINAPNGFIVAVPSENSDITANAFEGKGGFIDITAFGIFGLQRRDQLTPFSDITAFSQQNPQLNGIVQINTPDIDPNRGLVNLPSVPVDPKVAQSCAAYGSQLQNKFIITGRGGLPPKPSDPLSADAVQVDFVTLNHKPNQHSIPVVSTTSTSPTPSPIVEATSWVKDANGDIILTAKAPNATPYASWQKIVDCRAFN